MDKYSSKHPKLTKQELTRLMAKEFAKLSEEKKKVYGNMAQKSKNEMSATNKVASKTRKSPTLAANQSLFKAEKMIHIYEPLKPPASAAEILTLAEIDVLKHQSVDNGH
ncbi:hypothetical protein DAPPUDRAFT_328870 [Daphnia pulex]|uniref:HMG box domain-containing protein n=1 Tax=Daphnia pulex TaxID=6669 RepID=E9HF02_DAPPU|nr:hypothetical protein DAPPUDRAFT_328870 [Daphnia pulex]|eukprot:EFX69684.1 hypothetical protein DAPPUDRAFT_328870 [Daphnia pulex]